MIRYFFLLLLLVSLPLFSNETITFQDLGNDNLHGKKVTMHGFLYKGSEGTWILASEPNLKSCCIGAKSKADRQIAIAGELPNEPPLTAIYVQGTLTKEIGQSKYAIVDANIIEENKFPFWIVGLCIALGVLFLYLQQRYVRIK